MGKIRLRKMKGSDLKMMFELGIQHWGEDRSWLTREYLKSSFEQKGLSFVAEDDGKVIGGIIMVFEDIVRNWVRYLIISSEHRKQGIGKLLIGSLVSHLDPGESIFVDTGVVDKGALAFYEKMGFKNRGKVKSLYDRSSGYILEKNIN